MRNPFTLLGGKIASAVNTVKEALGFKPKDNESLRDKYTGEKMPSNVINALHNSNASKENKKRVNRMRRKMRRKTQQSQR